MPEGDGDSTCAAATSRTAVRRVAGEHAEGGADPQALGEREGLTGPVGEHQGVGEPVRAGDGVLAHRGRPGQRDQRVPLLQRQPAVGEPARLAGVGLRGGGVGLVEGDLGEGVEGVGGAGHVAAGAHDVEPPLVGLALAVEVAGDGPGDREHRQRHRLERGEAEVLGRGQRRRGELGAGGGVS